MAPQEDAHPNPPELGNTLPSLATGNGVCSWNHACSSADGRESACREGREGGLNFPGGAGVITEPVKVLRVGERGPTSKSGRDPRCQL